MTIAERIQLFQLASNVNGNAVEVGSYLGASACFLAKGLATNPSSRLYCVDTWNNDAMSEGTRDTFSIFMRNTTRFSKIISPLRGRSVDVSANFRESIQFLFLDGDHSFEGISSDWASWSRYLVPGAIVVLHDIGWAEGVQRHFDHTISHRLKNVERLPNMIWGTFDRDK